MSRTDAIATGLEIVPKVEGAISMTKQLSQPLSKIARTARLVDGEWIPEVVNKVPGVKHAWSFFGKTVEKPVAVVTHECSYG